MNIVVFQASYGVEDPQYAITQLAQTTMRSELGEHPVMFTELQYELQYYKIRHGALTKDSFENFAEPTLYILDIYCWNPRFFNFLSH